MDLLRPSLQGQGRGRRRRAHPHHAVAVNIRDDRSKGVDRPRQVAVGKSRRAAGTEHQVVKRGDIRKVLRPRIAHPRRPPAQHARTVHVQPVHRVVLGQPTRQLADLIGQVVRRCRLRRERVGTQKRPLRVDQSQHAHADNDGREGGFDERESPRPPMAAVGRAKCDVGWGKHGQPRANEEPLVDMHSIGPRGKVRHRAHRFSVPHLTSHIPHSPRAHFTSELILKMGRIIAMAINPTTEPIRMIITGSIMLVTALIFSRSCFW